MAVRAYDWVCSWIAMNENRFNGNSYAETWGKLSVDGKTLYIIASKLKSALKAEGYSFDAVKKKWAEKNQITKFPKGYTTNISIYGNKAHCVEFFRN